MYIYSDDTLANATVSSLPIQDSVRKTNEYELNAIDTFNNSFSHVDYYTVKNINGGANDIAIVKSVQETRKDGGEPSECVFVSATVFSKASVPPKSEMIVLKEKQISVHFEEMTPLSQLVI